MTSLYVHTPLVHSTKLSKYTPCKVYLKQEFNQPSGSFKDRGISHHVQKCYQKILSDPLKKDKKVIVVAPSGGNAGGAASHAAAALGLESIIVVPTLTNANMRQKLQDSGSKVIVAGNNFGETDEHLKTVVIPGLGDEYAAIYCHPFDDPTIWEGHASMIDEIVEELKSQGQLHHLKSIVCSVGGGGLYCGIVEGLERNGLKDVTVLTTECDTCPSFQAAIDAGEPTKIAMSKTIATTLGAPSVCEQSVKCYNEHKTRHVLVKDSQAAKACLEFAKDYNVIVEPACGAALAAVYDDLFTPNADYFGGLDKDDIVIIVVCGGAATTIDDLINYKQQYEL